MSRRVNVGVLHIHHAAYGLARHLKQRVPAWSGEHPNSARQASAPKLVKSTRPHDLRDVLRDLRIVTEYAMLQLSVRHGHLRRFRLVL